MMEDTLPMAGATPSAPHAPWLLETGMNENSSEDPPSYSAVVQGAANQCKYLGSP